ncbi:MAG: hypothetical protein AAB487_03330 [Patescibacteria group bacterium]
MGTMIEALREVQEEIRKYGQAKVLHGKWTLKELAKFVRIFNNSSQGDSLLRRSMMGILMGATHIYEEQISGVGTFESETQAQRNGPMIPGPRQQMIELDIKKDQLNILRRTLSLRPGGQWEASRIIPLAGIKKIKIVRVPVGLRYLEIELQPPCPD